MLKKNFYLTVVLILLAVPLFGQPNNSFSNAREVYLSASNFGDPSLEVQLKRGIGENWLFRFNLLNINYYSRRYLPTQPVIFSAQIRRYTIDFSAGVEKRNEIGKKLTAFYGLSAISYNSLMVRNVEDPSLSERLRRTESYDIIPGLGFHAGILYSLTENFYLAAELTPKFIFWDINTQDESRFDGYARKSEFNLSTQDILVSVVYRWDRKK